MRTLLLLLLLVPAAWAQEATARMRWRTGTFGKRAPIRVPLNETPPAGVKLPERPELPAEIVDPGPKPLYGAVGLAGTRLVVIVEPDRFWFDRNLKGDLSREPPVKWFGDETRYRNVHVPLRFPGEDPVKIEIVLSYKPAAKPPRLEATARAYREGSVVLAGRVRRVVLGDSDGDLRFDKPDGDPIFVDLDGDGRLGVHEELRAGVAFSIRGAGFVARVPSPTGAEVRFVPVDDVPPPPRRPWQAMRTSRPGRKAHGRGSIKDVNARYRQQVEGNTAGFLRRRVVFDIGPIGTPEAFALLWRIYRRDGDELVTQAAVGGMGYTQYVEHAPKVAKIAQGKDAKLRVEAIRALHNMAAPERRKVYERLLAHRHEPTAAAAARHLAFVGDDAARTALLAYAERGSKIRNRYHAYFNGTRYFATAPPLEVMQAAARAADERQRALGLKDMHYFLRPEAHGLAVSAARDKVRANDLAMVLVEILATEGSAEAVAAVLPFAEWESNTLGPRLLDLLRPVRDPGGVGVIAKGLAARIVAVRLLCARVAAELPQTTAALAAQLGREHDPAVAKAIVSALATHGGAEGASAIVAAARRLERDEEMRPVLLRALADIGLGQPAVRFYFESKMESARWQERVLAISAAARARSAEMAPLILKSLDHKTWQVRLAVVQAFRQIRVKEAIGPLIGRLGEEKEKRIRRAIGETLYRLTNKNFFSDYDLWARWWRGARDKFTVPNQVKPGQRASGETKTVARFYGLPVDSDRVVFVLDQSGSMSAGSPTDFEKAVAELLKVVDRLTNRAKINVIFFETGIHVWKKGLVGVNGGSRKQLKRYLGTLGPTGSTNLYDALEKALQHSECDTIYVLSDGAPTDGKFVDDRDILREVRKINELKRITIHTVSLGRDSSLLRRLADENGGRYTRR